MNGTFETRAPTHLFVSKLRKLIHCPFVVRIFLGGDFLVGEDAVPMDGLLLKRFIVATALGRGGLMLFIIYLLFFG